jgi:nucleoside-diphosphate-sugar epimerase
VRSFGRATEIADSGIEPLMVDALKPETLESLPVARRVLYCLGFDAAGGVNKRTVFVDGLRNLLEHLSASPSRLVYTSSTRVYGQLDGGWVDEDSLAHPIQEGGHVCLLAEQVASCWA